MKGLTSCGNSGNDFCVGSNDHTTREDVRHPHWERLGFRDRPAVRRRRARHVVGRRRPFKQLFGEGPP